MSEDQSVLRKDKSKNQSKKRKAWKTPEEKSNISGEESKNEKIVWKEKIKNQSKKRKV